MTDYLGLSKIANAIDKGTTAQESTLQFQKDVAYNQMLKDTFEDRVLEKHGVSYQAMSQEGKLLVKKYLLTAMLRKVE